MNDLIGVINPFKKRALRALFLFTFLTSCCGSSVNCWQGESAVGETGSCNSARIYLGCTKPTGLELEFVNMRDGLRLYLNVFGLAIPPDPDDASQSRVFISFKDHSYTFSAQRFLGGQRLLIPENVMEEMIEYLQQNQSVFIQVDRYKADIYPDKFLSLFKCMVRST